MSDKEAFYLKYGQQKWYSRSFKFPDGRHPYRDLFRKDSLVKLVNEMGSKVSCDIDLLQNDLQDFANSYLTVVMTTPLPIKDMGPEWKTPDERIRWHNANVLNPTCTLLKAFRYSQAPYLAEWPEEPDWKLPSPDLTKLVPELIKLKARVGFARDALQGQIIENYRTEREFKHNFGYDLKDIFVRRFPSCQAHRDQTEKTLSKKQSSQTLRYDGPFVTFIKYCCEQIFGNRKFLSNEMIDAL